MQTLDDLNFYPTSTWRTELEDIGIDVVQETQDTVEFFLLSEDTTRTAAELLLLTVTDLTAIPKLTAIMRDLVSHHWQGIDVSTNSMFKGGSDGILLVDFIRYTGSALHMENLGKGCNLVEHLNILVNRATYSKRFARQLITAALNTVTDIRSRCDLLDDVLPVVQHHLGSR